MSSIRMKSSRNFSDRKLLEILSRFTKDDIIKNILPTKVEKLDIFIRKRKDMIIREALKILMEEFYDLDDLILYLHLQYSLCTKNKRNWNILEIKDAKRLRNYNLAPEKVSISIQKYFTKYNTECKVLSEEKDGCIWIVMLLGGSIYEPIQCIAHVKLSLIFVANLKSDFSVLTEKVLRKSFRGSDIKQLTNFAIGGRNIARLTIKSWNNLYKKIAPQDGKGKESRSIKEQNKVINNAEQNIIVDSEVQSPNKKFKGTEFEECAIKSVPVIQSFSFEVCSVGLCKKEKENFLSFACIKFQGTNILEGLDKLIDCGIAIAPLPSYLCEPRCGKTL